jgi:hypothetical protein
MSLSYFIGGDAVLDPTFGILENPALVVTDGTAAGTHILKGPASLFFDARNKPWRSALGSSSSVTTARVRTYMGLNSGRPTGLPPGP